MNPSLPSRRFSVPAYLGLQRTQLNLIESKTFYIKVISIRVPEAATLCLDDQFDHGAQPRWKGQFGAYPNSPCHHSSWEETGVPEENRPRLSGER